MQPLVYFIFIFLRLFAAIVQAYARLHFHLIITGIPIAEAYAHGLMYHLPLRHIAFRYLSAIFLLPRGRCLRAVFLHALRRDFSPAPRQYVR